MNYKIYYYYSPTCKACKDYLDSVEKVCKALRIELEKHSINGYKPQHKIDGVPCVILENNGVELYRSLGNLPFQHLYKDIKSFI